MISNIAFTYMSIYSKKAIVRAFNEYGNCSEVSFVLHFISSRV